jgi:hypothetical protein
MLGIADLSNPPVLKLAYGQQRLLDCKTARDLGADRRAKPLKSL